MRSLGYIAKIIRFMRDDEVEFWKKILFLVPVFYLILPFDLIGDFFPILGQLDDIAVFVVMIPILKNFLSSYYDTPSTKNKDDDSKTINMNKDDYKVD
ncbi:MAG: YkvA family protein [Bacillota bacterium]